MKCTTLVEKTTSKLNLSLESKIKSLFIALLSKTHLYKNPSNLKVEYNIFEQEALRKRINCMGEIKNNILFSN